MLELAIYGGTFAPVHNGHVHAAKAFFEAVRPDKLLIIPTLIPPHKQIDFSDDPTDRLNMLKLAFEADPFFEGKLQVSDYELHAPAPSYTVNTLRHFKTSDTHITFLVGTDMFLTLDKWKESSEIFKLCRIAYMLRESDNSENKAKVCEKQNIYHNIYQADIICINESPIEISSSELRSADNDLRKKYLPEAVYEYVKERHLYDN